MFEFLVMNRGKGLECEIHIDDIIDVEDFHHARCAVIQRVTLTREESCLLHLLLAQLWFENDIFEPGGLGQPYFRYVLLLTVIKLAEKCPFDLIDVLNVHLFLLFLDLDQLKERVGPSRFPILFHVSLENFLDVFLTKLLRVYLRGHRVDICKLVLEHLLEENGRELHYNTV